MVKQGVTAYCGIYLFSTFGCSEEGSGIVPMSLAANVALGSSPVV
jgi:hypothetical protein